MSTFIDWLTSANQRDARVRAVLRRSLAFDPGAYAPAYPYVERFLQADDSGWRRTAHYLVAALWALHWKEGRQGPPLSIARAMASYALTHHSRDQLSKGDSSTERRFVALLDADAEQLPHRLRQAVALLKDETLDFDLLVQDLQYWHAQHSPVQLRWAQDFYRTLEPNTPTDEPTAEQEEAA